MWCEKFPLLFWNTVRSHFIFEDVILADSKLSGKRFVVNEWFKTLGKVGAKVGGSSLKALVGRGSKKQVAMLAGIFWFNAELMSGLLKYMFGWKHNMQYLMILR